MKTASAQLIVAGGILALVLGGYGVWYHAVAAQSAQVADLKKQVDTRTSTQNRIAQARAALAEIAGDETAVQSYFVSDKAVVGFIDSLEQIGASQHAPVEVLSVSAATTGAHPTLTLSITTQGTFDAVMRTVGAIEFAPYDLSISSLTIAQNDQKLWHADLSLVVGSAPATTASSTPSTAAPVPPATDTSTPPSAGKTGIPTPS